MKMARFSFAIPLVRAIYFVLISVFIVLCFSAFLVLCIFIDVLLRRNNKRMNNDVLEMFNIYKICRLCCSSALEFPQKNDL